MEPRQSALVDNVSLLHSFHSVQDEPSFPGSAEGVKNHSSSMPCIRQGSGGERADAGQLQADGDIVEDLIGDELDGKSSCGYRSLIDPGDTTTMDHEQVHDAPNGTISCPIFTSPGELQSEPLHTGKHKEVCQLQPLPSSENLSQSMSTKSVSTESSTSSVVSSGALPSSASYIPVDCRSVRSEEPRHCAEPSNSNRHGLKQDTADISEGTGMGGSRENRVALLQALPAEKDEDVSQIREELMKRKLMNQQLLKEQCLVMSMNNRLHKESNEAGGVAFHTNMGVPVLHQHIEHLKCHLTYLQDANDSTINELTKADEEISQLRGEIAELRAKHTEELQAVKEESDYFKTKFTRLYCDASQNTAKSNTDDLLEQIQQLRTESRKLREVIHKLDEENHQLKEILWDLKQQDKWLSKQFKGNKGDAEITKKGHWTLSGTKAQVRKGESETVLQKMSSVPPCLHSISPSSQISFEYFNIEDKSGPVKSNQQESVMTFDQRLRSCEDVCVERSASSCSSDSIDSNDTEALLASCNDVTDGQLINPKVHHGEDSLPELDRWSEDDMSFVHLNNPHQRFHHEHCSSSPLCKSLTSSVGFSSSCLTRKTRGLVNKVVLPRRPFAPRGIADLKLGHLVKFSRPAGKIGKGVIRYRGHLPGRQEAYLGVELEGTEVGRHNGTFEGVRYFTCKLNKGVFVNFSKVIMAWE
ncbi:golgin subfamily A member 5-like isoform X1 [Amblyraja radiata]|uniref:golgin subfamily A member 5-like isoform X1 n=1 Tax=Amblyraja radiata TaxID=386614 RepID=UPI001402F423|nr:golgin subfamily A member 5-like isoform X1 [Amblyraja radiata]